MTMSSKFTLHLLLHSQLVRRDYRLKQAKVSLSISAFIVERREFSSLLSLRCFILQRLQQHVDLPVTKHMEYSLSLNHEQVW